MQQLHFYRDPQLPCYEIKEGQYNIPAAKYHCHHELSIGIIESGTSMVSCQGTDFFVGQHHLVIFPPQIMHRCIPANIKLWKFKMLYIDTAWLQSVFPYSQSPLFSVAVKKLSPRSIKKVKAFFSFLASRASSWEKENELMIVVAKLLAVNSMFIYCPLKRQIDQDAYLLRTYLEKHYLENITLDEMTKFVGMTKYHLIRLFHKSYAVTPHAYITQLRLHHAKKMLKRGVDISYAACESGFYDQSHFSKIFKQCCGVTPLIYQRLA